MNSDTGSTPATPPTPATPTKPVRISDLLSWKAEGSKWAMLTAYDYSTAQAMSQADIPVLLVGDSAANVIYGYKTTTEVSLDEMIPLARGVVRGAGKALVVADLPFGTYEASDEQAVLSAARMMRESGAHAVKIEGGVRIAPRIRALVDAGIPVMAHIGFTPQSVHSLSGFKVQGRAGGADTLRADARPPSASAPAGRQTPRCWCGRTWWSCPPVASRLSLSADSVPLVPRLPTPRGTTATP